MNILVILIIKKFSIIFKHQLDCGILVPIVNFLL